MFGSVIVDDDGLPLNIGSEITVLTRTTSFPTTVPTTDPLAATLLTTFFAATDPSNWKDYTKTSWNVNLPGVDVDVNGDNIADLNLNDLDTPVSNPKSELQKPSEKGIGDVLVDTQFELTLNKLEGKRESMKPADASPLAKPGTITEVDAEKWKVTKKIGLPEISMNHPHNMWTNEDEDIIYQTQWFDSRLVAIDRYTGEVVKDVKIGQSPSHVITSPTTDKIYIAMNGEEQVLELDPLTLKMTRQFSTGENSHPHGHWISSDGKCIVTPNFFTNEIGIINVDTAELTTVPVQEGPIAIGMTTLDNGYHKVYSANFLGNSLSTITLDSDCTPGDVTNIDLLQSGTGLPIQTPVSPDGKWLVTANVLFSKITVLDTSTDTVVAVLDCDPGCHGVNWGAKEDGGFYAYITNKFSNALIVVDPDPNDNGDGSDAKIAGKVLLAKSPKEKDDRIVKYHGMGGQGVLALPLVYPGWGNIEELESSEEGSESNEESSTEESSEEG